MMTQRASEARRSVHKVHEERGIAAQHSQRQRYEAKNLERGLIILSNLAEKLANHQFCITLELDPPRGPSADDLIEQAKSLEERLDAINIADCPMAKLRMSPIAVARILQEKTSMDAIFHLTCRDRNLLGLQAELLGAAGLGVKHILALTGDSPQQGDHPTATGVFDTDGIGLIKIVNQFNQGLDFNGNPLNSPTHFSIGTTANPTAADLEGELEKLQKKVAAGAHFVQTQPIFEAEKALTFLDKTRDLPIRIIFGILPLRSASMADYLHEKVPGIEVPDQVRKRMHQEGRAGGIAIARELVRELRKSTAGVHLMPLNHLDVIPAILD